MHQPPAKVHFMQGFRSSSFSRRCFLRTAGLAAAALPILTEHTLAQAALPPGAAPDLHTGSTAAVLLNANENPQGPCAAARAAITRAALTGGRYDVHNETGRLATLFAQQNNLPEDHIAVYAGSSEPLHFAVLAFTSPLHGYVTADPSYESGMIAAMAARARISRVPLAPDYAHDLRAMVSADSRAGLIYICNPNNPTGTLTPRAEIEFALAHKPKGAILLVDEAYIHLASAAESVLDLVAAGQDLIVLRTFSKIYGMAGIRCGLALGRPDLLARLQLYGTNPMPITAVAAANASLEEPDLIRIRRAEIAATREQTFRFLSANNWRYIPSESNCFMIQTGRPGHLVAAAMREQRVLIGRTWPIWPNAVRVSVGTAAEMLHFQTAFKQVMDNTPPPPRSARFNDPLADLPMPPPTLTAQATQPSL